MPEFFAYIDESGDEGVNRGRQWFAVAAVIVEAGQENSQLGQTLAQVKQTINLRKPVLHWTDLSHPRKLAVSQGLAQAKITSCVVLVDTWHPRIQSSTLLGGKMYFYAFRWLVERISGTAPIDRVVAESGFDQRTRAGSAIGTWNHTSPTSKVSLIVRFAQTPSST